LFWSRIRRMFGYGHFSVVLVLYVEFLRDEEAAFRAAQHHGIDGDDDGGG
jgi:hypothetical protein